MNLKKLVCYFDTNAPLFPLFKDDVEILMMALRRFHEDDFPIILPNTIKLEYLDAFSLKKFVKTTASKLKLWFGK